MLVVDDDPSVLQVVKMLAEMDGHVVDCANSAESGMSCLSSGAYDLVLLDYRMPGHDGLWFLQNANLQGTTRVVMMTAYATGDFTKRAAAMGASSCLMKPFTKDDLLGHVRGTVPATT